MSKSAPARFSTSPVTGVQVLLRTMNAPLPPHTTVPALVSGPYRDLAAAPPRLSNPVLATINGPEITPAFQLSTPLTVLLPLRVEPFNVRLVIVPPWKLVP